MEQAYGIVWARRPRDAHQLRRDTHVRMADTHALAKEAIETPVKNFWTVNSLGLEPGAQSEFQTFAMTASAVPVLVAIAMLAQETIEYAAVLRPDKKIFKYLFLGIDIILGKLLTSAGLLRSIANHAFHPICSERLRIEPN